MSLIVEVDFFNAYIARHVRSTLKDDFFCQNGIWLPGATLPGPYRFDLDTSNYPSIRGAMNLRPGPGTEYDFFGDVNPFRPVRSRKGKWLQGAWTADPVSGQGWGPVTSPNVKKFDFVFTQYILPPFFSQEKQTTSGLFGRNIFQKIRKRREAANSGSLNAQIFELQVSSLSLDPDGPCDVYIAIEQCQWNDDGERDITSFDKKYLEEIADDGNGNKIYGAKIEIGPSEDFRRLLYIIGNDGSCGGDGDNEAVRENLPITYAAIGPKVFYGKKFAQTSDNWYLEEGRIRGGFNNTSTGQGVRAYLDEPEPLQQKRINTLIYSGIYNSRTGINQTNVFSVGTDITKSLDPSHGSIQLTHAEDTNLIVFQENRIHRALIDKDVIYTTESGTQTQAGNAVIGQFVPYTGDYGISKNPESFAIYNYRKYFSDRNRNAIMRLSNDGLTEISMYGMLDWFRDNLAEMKENTTISVEGAAVGDISAGSLIGDFAFRGTSANQIQVGMKILVDGFISKDDNIIVTFIEYIDTAIRLWFNKPIPFKLQDGTSCDFIISYKSEIIGGWDIHNKQYVVSLQRYPNKLKNIQGTENNRKDSYTLVFDEKINGWVSFMSYKPDFMFSILNKFYSTESENLWQHYNEVSPYRTKFYDDIYDSSITFVFNQGPSTMKNFTTINYEGGSGWEVEGFTSGKEGMTSVAGSWQEFDDTIKPVKSYEEGLYYDALTGQPLRAGFNRKENKYVANIISDSVIRPGEVRSGPVTTGIKGYFATVKIKTDSTTDPGGIKELWSAGSDFMPTSGF